MVASLTPSPQDNFDIAKNELLHIEMTRIIVIGLTQLMQKFPILHETIYSFVLTRQALLAFCKIVKNEIQFVLEQLHSSRSCSFRISAASIADFTLSGNFARQ
jgi:hypothetical protein